MLGYGPSGLTQPTLLREDQGFDPVQVIELPGKG